MSGNKNKLIAFNYFGGKFTWLEYLYENFPSEFTHMVDLFRGLYAEGDTIHVTVANKSLVEFMEQPNRLHLIRQVLDHRCGAGKKLHYRIPKS